MRQGRGRFAGIAWSNLRGDAVGPIHIQFRLVAQTSFTTVYEVRR